MIAVDRVRGRYSPSADSLRVGHRYGQVVLSSGGKSIEIDTPTAIKVCLALGRLYSKLEAGEFINLQINGEDIHLLPDLALKVSGALLRKADAADDWQLASAKPLSRRH